MSDIISIDKKTLRKLQLKELESLVYFDEFCKKNNLTYFLLGGCVIGALRHGGFIPWDDDIDIIMPRDCWEKMLKLWNEQEKGSRFLMLKTDEHTFTGNTFATLVDTSATLIKENQQHIDVPKGIVTDIFPLDGCPDGKIARYLQYYHAMIYSLFITEVIPANHGKFIALVSKVLLSIFKSRKTRTKIWKKAEQKLKKYDFYKHEYCTELYAGPYYMRKKYPQKAFSKAVYHMFENLNVPIPCGYDIYLKTAFGDYMQIPPEDKQVPHHDLVALDLDKPYNSNLE